MRYNARMARVLVIGSSNTDMFVKVGRLPSGGETILGESFYMAQGGKGANQAVAARRAGADVAFVGRVGADPFGKAALDALKAEGIDVQDLRVDPDHPSGVALILVDPRGENMIAVAPGANMAVTPADVTAERVRWADVVVLQLEIPLQSVEGAIRLARREHRQVVLNYAPAPKEPCQELLAEVDFVILNESELAAAGFADPEELQSQIRGTAILTLGARGVVYFDPDPKEVPAEKVTAVDTVGAGDAFVGTFSTFIAEGLGLVEAVRLANRAAAITVTRKGAQPSLPTRREIEDFRS